MTPEAVLAAIPQQPPFRFVDEILEIDQDHVVASYRWPPESDFYRGHFPGDPITPGVLLVESMAQAGVVALGIYILGKNPAAATTSQLVTLLTDATFEFSGVVRPGERVVITGHRMFYRHRVLRVRVEMHREDGGLVCAGVLSGMGVRR